MSILIFSDLYFIKVSLTPKVWLIHPLTDDEWQPVSFLHSRATPNRHHLLNKHVHSPSTPQPRIFTLPTVAPQSHSCSRVALWESDPNWATRIGKFPSSSIPGPLCRRAAPQGDLHASKLRVPLAEIFRCEVAED